MRIAVFSSKAYDRQFLNSANDKHRHDLVFFEGHLSEETVGLAQGFTGVCAFVNDHLNAGVIQTLARFGVGVILLRSAGYNHVDLRAASEAGVTVARVPAYSPHAVAEHAMAMILTLNRKLHRAWARVREGNFALDGLLGFDLVGKTVGVIGTGRIGSVFAEIATGFGCKIFANDLLDNPDLRAAGARYVDLHELLESADIISLHVPLTPQTHHLIDDAAIGRMKTGVVLVNTSRGGVVDTAALIRGLKKGKVGGVALDVYEEEADLFFEDLSASVIQDDVFARLLTFPNVLITGHQGFFTREAMDAIAETTLSNATAFERGSGTIHTVTHEVIGRPTPEPSQA